MAAYGRSLRVLQVVRVLCGRQAARVQLKVAMRGACGSPWCASAALTRQITFMWQSHRRNFTSESPYEEDEYPPLPEYCSLKQADKKEVFIVRVKGLPWSCRPEDLLTFFSECQIRSGVNGIHLLHNKDGRQNGQAFIELEHEVDVPKALERHRQYMGNRYVEVYEVTNSDAEAILKGVEESAGTDAVVRLQGLPFSCTENDIAHFFSGLQIAKDGITIATDRRGRSSGIAYVEFTSREMADQALLKDREVIGTRYILVFPSSKSEIQTQNGRGREENSATVLQRQRTGAVSVPVHHIHMRGLPFQATAKDVVNFFSPIRLSKLLIEYGPDGRPSGEADVYFTSHQHAMAAMSKDREYMQDRYIELFLNSPKEERN